jgi:hypothetical protein
MNEQTEKAMIELINSATSAKNFLLAELPEVVNQLLVWKFWVSLVLLISGILLLAAIFFAIYKTWKYRQAIVNNDYGIFILFIVSFFCVSGFPASLLMIFNGDWLQILLAPKLYLIEYVASLGK